MPDKPTIATLFSKYLEGKCDPGEVAQLLAYFNHPSEEDRLRALIRSELSQPTEVSEELQREAGLVYPKVMAAIESVDAPPVRKIGKPFRLFTTRRQAAVWIGLVCMAATLVYIYRYKHEPQYLTVKTESGERREVRLPDGSVVRLNAGSRLRYPETWTRGEREVRLEGEAFFSIERNPEMPFVVEANGLETRVLGTSFNVRAYAAEKRVVVAVASGKVAVKPKKSRALRELAPGQQIMYIPETRYLSEVVAIAPENAGSRFEKALHFRNEPFSAVIATLEEVYGIHIRFDNALADCKVMHADFDHTTQSAEQVLQMLMITMEGAVKKESESSYTLIGKECN